MSTSVQDDRTSGAPTPTGRGDRWPLWPAAVAALVSGVAVFVNGLAVRHFDDATAYTTAKNLWAGLLLAVALVAVPVPAAHRAPTIRRETWPWLAVVAVIGGAVPFVLFFEGLALATSTDAAFVHKTLVVWVALGAAIVLRERLRPSHLVAIALLVGGHVVVSGGVSLSGVGRGEALVLVATLFWAVEVLVVKRLLVTVPARHLAVVRMLGGSLVLLAWLLIRGELGALGGFSTAQWWWIAATGSTLAVFVSLWYRALAAAPATDVTAVLVAGAVVTAILNTGLRGVPITVDAVGYLVVLAGVVIVAASSERTAAASPSHGLVS